jgi:hypothetical protein
MPATLTALEKSMFIIVRDRVLKLKSLIVNKVRLLNLIVP